jgi:hypothetical protein
MLNTGKAASIMRLGKPAEKIEHPTKKEQKKPMTEEAQIVKEEKRKGGFSGIIEWMLHGMHIIYDVRTF